MNTTSPSGPGRDDPPGSWRRLIEEIVNPDSLKRDLDEATVRRLTEIYLDPAETP